MVMNKSTFDYLEPTEHQKDVLLRIRAAVKHYAAELDAEVPDGPDKTYLMRKLREVAMWANIAVTRQPDGSPRE